MDKEILIKIAKSRKCIEDFKKEIIKLAKKQKAKKGKNKKGVNYGR